MKLDFISIVVLIFCLGVCVGLFVEVKNVFNTFSSDAGEVVVAESNK